MAFAEYECPICLREKDMESIGTGREFISVDFNIMSEWNDSIFVCPGPPGNGIVIVERRDPLSAVR